LPRLSGRWLRIVLLDGKTIYGRVKKQDTDALTLDRRAPVRLSEIQTVEATDRTWDGGLKGFAVGAAIGVAATKGHSKAVPITTGLIGLYMGGFLDGSRGIFEPVYGFHGPSLVGETIRVVDADGRVTLGYVWQELRDVLVLDVPGERASVRIARDRVTKIEIGDRRSRGQTALYGALAGMGVGVAAGFVGGDARGDAIAKKAGDRAIAFGVLGVPVGALVGAIIGPGQVHWKDVTSQHTTIRLTPIATLHRVGLDGTITW